MALHWYTHIEFLFLLSDRQQLIYDQILKMKTSPNGEGEGNKGFRWHETCVRITVVGYTCLYSYPSPLGKCRCLDSVARMLSKYLLAHVCAWSEARGTLKHLLKLRLVTHWSLGGQVVNLANYHVQLVLIQAPRGSGKTGGLLCTGDSLVFIFPLAPMLTFTSAVGKLNVRVLWHHYMLLQVISQRYCQVFVKSYNFVFEKIDKEGSPREKWPKQGHFCPHAMGILPPPKYPRVVKQPPKN